MDQDARISRLARALPRADTEEIFTSTCRQIQELLEIGENRRYVARSFNCLLTPLESTFKFLSTVKWPKAVEEYAKLLAKVANSVDVSGVKFFPWIFEVLDKGNPDLHSGDVIVIVQDVFFRMIEFLSTKSCHVLLANIHDIMTTEKFQSAEAFRALCSAFIKVLGQGATCKTQTFQEFTDVVIGWMVDEDQSENKTYMFCAEILLKLETYFAYDAAFTSHLLVQILDDLEDSILEIQTNQGLNKLTRIFLLVKAYATITAIPCQLEKNYQMLSSERFMSNVLKALSISHVEETEYSFVFKTKRKIIQHTLDYLAHTEYADGNSARLLIKELVEKSLLNAENGSMVFPTLKDLSHGINAWIQLVSSYPNVDEECLELIDTILKLFDTEFSTMSEDDPLNIMTCIHSLLRSRCVVVLQRVYSWLVGKCQIFSPEPRTGIADKNILCTVIIGLCDVASSKANSILTRWALDPPVFDVLMSIYKCSDDRTIKLTVLKVLKAHCVSQSHFVSSAFSQFSADAPGPSHMFLDTLMEFWIETIRTEDTSVGKWIVEWIVAFFGTSSGYSAVLAESYSNFYVNLLAVLNEKPDLYLEYAKLLHFLCSEPSYENTVIYALGRDTAVGLLTRAKEMNKETRLQLLALFEDLSEIVVFEAGFKEGFLNVGSSTPEASPPGSPKSLLCSQLESSDVLMTPSEFDEFLSDLLTIEVVDGGDNISEAPTYNRKAVSAAVDLLIRGKLKSPLGKPPDLFSQLQGLFKKYRNLKAGYRIPSWKLDFVHHLDTEIHLAMQESLTNRCNLPDAIKNFYTTNRIPCIEWLKRLRLDVAEVAIQTGNFELAFLYASFAADETRIKRASFGLKDADTLKSLQEIVLSHYCAGRFEEALRISEMVKKIEAKPEGQKVTLEDVNKAVCEVLSSLACKSLQDWSEKDLLPPNNGPKELKVQEQPPIPLLNLPSSNIPQILSNCILDFTTEKKKTSILAVGKEDHVLDIHTLLQLANLIGNTADDSSNILPELSERILVLKMNRLLEKGNVNLVRSLLAQQKMVSLFEGTQFLVDFNLHCLRCQADTLFLEGEVDKSANIYSAISSLLENAQTEEFKSFRNEFVLSYTEKLGKDERFAIAVLDNLQLNSSNLSEKHTIIQSEFIKYLSSPEQDEDCWYAYGSYLYNLQGEQIDPEEMKMKALDAFSQYVMLYGSNMALQKLPSLRTARKKSPTLITAMIRILKLFQEGYEVDPELVFVHDEWLTLLPSLTQIDKMQGALFRRFPKQVGFHIASQQAQKKDMFKICIKDRKTLFDPDSYGFYEYTEDSSSARSKPTEEKYRFPVDAQTGLRTSSEIIAFDEDQYVNLPTEVRTVFRELQRIGSSREDQWLFAFQRLHVDWHKRIGSLKDDLARDSSPELFRSYSLPVIIYFEELLRLTLQCETLADSAFVVRHKNSITRIIQSFRSSQTVEDLLQAYGELSKWVNSLHASAEPKTLISIISPVLANFNFESSSFSVTLPGIPVNVSVVRVEPHVHVLATKTRPKRLTFRGSDGKSYSYLVKGSENLNVDSGVMQFMNIVEHLVQWPARSYSVTPLGKKGGLIQLVPNTTPLFYLYKKFLQKNGIDDRTTDIFWSRMNALGHCDRSNPAALRQVFDQLQKETSPDILSKELFLTARNPKAWYNSVHTLTSDCAMGSAIGYVLGIGDRHLDNILVDLKTGYFIHVDFSLVFGKGVTLRVPEKVPFRLTQNICAALKHPGQSGSFKILLERFLQTMKTQTEAVFFGVQAVAGAHGIVDDLPINPLPILQAELNSAATILKSRQKKIQRPGTVLKTDLMDMCKELNATKVDAAGMEGKLEACAKDIENLTIALGIMNEKKSDPEKLKYLRDKCEFAAKRREVLKNVASLNQKLQQGIINLQEALSNRDELSTQTDRNWEVLHEVKRNLSSSRNKAWFDVIVLFQDAIELADITLTFSWVSLRHPITCHTISRVVEAIEDVSTQNLKVKPVTGCHTSKTAKAVWTLLQQDVTTTEDQIQKLRHILMTQGISDVEEEIRGTELRCASTEETLSRYTLISPTGGPSSDMDVFLKFAVPFLQAALTESPIIYDFVVKILLLCQNAANFQIPSETYEVLESLINLHVKARDDLSLFVDGHFETLLQDGFKVISAVSTVLEALTGETTSDYAFSREQLMERWRSAVMELEKNMINFKSWLTGADFTKFEITSDVVTNILAPISNFTLPLTQECQKQIFRKAQELVSMFYQYGGTLPSPDDPLAVLFTELKTLETRIRFLKDLHHSLDGCESAALFLSTEKDRFEWAFQNYLQKKIAPSEKRWEYGLNSIVELLEDFSTKWLQLDDTNEYLNGSKSLQGFQYPNLLPEMFAYMRSVYKFVTAVVTFESNRFNKIFVEEYNEIKKQLASLEKKQPVIMGSGDLSVAEEYIVNHSEAGNAKMQPRSSAGDRNWAAIVEKLITTQLQAEMQKKKQINDCMTKSSKSDKLIATRMSRIVNRWRRVIANLHPTIMFIYKYAKTTETIKVYKLTIDNDWLPRVAQFWLFRTEEDQLADPNALHEAFDFSEGTLRVLAEILEDAGTLEISDNMVGQYSTIASPASQLLGYTQDKINSFNKTVTVDNLIEEATRPETLAKMYEGWSAWV